MIVLESAAFIKRSGLCCQTCLQIVSRIPWRMVSLTNSQGLSHVHSLHIHHDKYDKTISAGHGKLTHIARLIVYSTIVVIIIIRSLEDTVWFVCNSNKWYNCCCPESLYDDWFLAWLIVVQWFCQKQYSISSYPLLFLFQVAACEIHL